MLAVMRRALVEFGVRRIAAGVLVVIVSFAAALWGLDALFPRGASRPPTLAVMAPLRPATRISNVTAPIAVALTAIRDTMEQQAPRSLAGKRDNPLTELLSKADIGWTLARGPIAIAGRTEALTISTTLNGTLHVTRQLGTKATRGGGGVGGLL